jgi:hypothetical protein
MVGGAYITAVQSAAAGASFIPADLRFFTATNAAAPTERMRIDSSGRLQVNTTGNNGTIAVQGVASARPCIHSRHTATTSQNHIEFHNPNGQVGSISTLNSATAYNTSSDYRLKHDIQPMTGALAKVAQLKPVTYKWNADDSQSQGFIAHELQEVVPECVTGEKDAVEIVEVKDENGEVIGTEERPVYQGIDTSFLVATLTAALQEAVAEINSLKASVEALDARLTSLEGAQE